MTISTQFDKRNPVGVPTAREGAKLKVQKGKGPRRWNVPTLVNKPTGQEFIVTVNVPLINIHGRKYSRSQIAKDTGLDISHISKIFNGQRKPSLSNALTLAAYFHITVEELMAFVVPGTIKLAAQYKKDTLDKWKKGLAADNVNRDSTL